MEHPSPDNVILGLLAVHPVMAINSWNTSTILRVWARLADEHQPVICRAQAGCSSRDSSPDADRVRRPLRRGPSTHITEAGQDSLTIWLPR